MRRIPRPLSAFIPHHPSRRTPVLPPFYQLKWRNSALRESGWPARRSHSSDAAPTLGKDHEATALPDARGSFHQLPFKFETGIALFAKSTPRPFPPPFLSPPSGSFSDPLSTHHRSRDRRAFVNGELIKGWTNGDDAVYESEYFIAADDGVGAWASRPRGHAGLWARLILHFWATAIEEDAYQTAESEYTPNPVKCLQKAYEQTIEATSEPNEWQGTTTATGAQLYYRNADSSDFGKDETVPVLYVTNLGDSQVMVVRPSKEKLIFKTKEQWHWFDCPRQLGTNSPDTPLKDAQVDVLDIEEGDVVLAMSDGVIDNLWSHEIVTNVCKSIHRWEAGEGGQYSGDRTGGAGDPFAESPFMEHAVEEGLASEGGKLDDISVVAALCKRDGP